MYRSLLIIFLVLALASCATYFEVHHQFHQHFASGELEAAEKELKKNSRVYKKKTRFLYFANRGVVDHLGGDYEDSNYYLEKAFIYGEDYRTNAGDVTLSFLTNPNRVEYPGEDHEHLLLLYYKALNYLYLDDYESALVECRRLNNRLNELSDKYRSDNKYRRDAFIHNLMGLVYDAAGDYNNAFIAYRNAYDIYRDDYTRFFGVGTPDQLKKDLIRSAYLTGFTTEAQYYEREFDISYEPRPSDAGDLIFFWNNGLGPVKDELSINFVTKKRQGGVVFVNDQYGWSFPFALDGNHENEDKLTDLEIFRVTLPRYVERPLRYQGGVLHADAERYPLEVAEDVNAIAFKILEQRLVLEMGKSLIRAGIKKAIEETIEKENEGLGFLVGLVNAATEKADTRNWQTIPHSILYTRIPLREGRNEVSLIAEKGSLSRTLETFTFESSGGRTQFHAYQTLN